MLINRGVFSSIGIIIFSLLLFSTARTSSENAKPTPDSQSLEIEASSADGGIRPTVEVSSHIDPPTTATSEIGGDDAIGGTSLFWISKKFHITCCLGGIPVVSHPEFVQNFSFHLLSFVIDEQANGIGQNCRLFKGSYLLPPPRVFHTELNYITQVVCKCPDIGSSHMLDKNCRRLPTCLNNGFRSLIDPLKCLCLQPFFGDKCEKFCDQGQRLRGVDGRDYCSCSHLYRGEECRDVICLNGGTEDGGRCICPLNFLGFHCEIDANKTLLHHQYGGSSSRFQRFGEQHNEIFTRDISGTIFSLIMIVVLVVSMYLLMKHRMQMHSRYLSRRPDLLHACNFPSVPTNGASTRRMDLFPGDHSAEFRSIPFRGLGNGRIGAPVDGGPPPYVSVARQDRSSRMRNGSLPPLPSYEDATKLPALVRQNTEAEQNGQRATTRTSAEENRETDVPYDHSTNAVVHSTAAESRSSSNLSLKSTSSIHSSVTPQIAEEEGERNDATTGADDATGLDNPCTECPSQCK